MGAWYLIGVLAGLGTAIGALCSGVVPGRIAVLVAAAVAGAIGVELYGWAEALGGLLGGAAGGFGTIPIVRGARRRGGTRWGLASLIGLGLVLLPRNPVTFGVFFTRCQASSVRSIFTST